jgi:DNA-binding SARP family transcriptional activator
VEKLHLRLLGPVSVLRGGSATAVPGRKALAVLVYLACLGG